MKHNAILFLLAVVPFFSSCTKDDGGCGKNTPLPPADPVYFSENFDGQGVGMAGWILYNDGNHPDPRNPADCSRAWSAHDMALYNGNHDNRMALSTSFFTQENSRADRWMVSPQFKVLGDDPYLYWEELAPDPMSPQTYTLSVSPTGTPEKANFTEVLYTVPEGKSASQTNAMCGVSLKAFKGKTIRIAFRNNCQGGFLIAVDNIFLSPNKATCLPNNMDARTLGTSSVSVHWLGGGAATSGSKYELSLVPYGEQPAVVMQTVSDTAYTFSGLEAGKRYHCYVRSVGQPVWIGPYPVQAAANLPLENNMSNPFLPTGWIPDNLDLVKTSPIDGSPALSIQGVAGDVNPGFLYTPPIEIEADEDLTISYDYYTEGVEGAVALWVGSGPGAMVSMMDMIDFEDMNIPANKLHHCSIKVKPIAEKGVYVIGLQAQVYAEKKVDNFRIYVDNFRIERTKK